MRAQLIEQRVSGPARKRFLLTFSACPAVNNPGKAPGLTAFRDRGSGLAAGSPKLAGDEAPFTQRLASRRSGYSSAPLGRPVRCSSRARRTYITRLVNEQATATNQTGQPISPHSHIPTNGERSPRMPVSDT